MLPSINLLQLTIVLLPLLFAVTIHETAHGWTAWRFGDPTAMLAGRLTLNPVKHLDIFGSLVLPLILLLTGAPVVFGYAKPVPVNFRNLKRMRIGTLCVASAGVAANFAAALVFSGVLQALRLSAPSLFLLESGTAAAVITRLLVYTVIINLVLGIFNLIPVPPLDGGKILAELLPANLKQRFQSIEPFGIFILIILLMTNFLDLFVSFFISPVINLMLQGYV